MRETSVQTAGQGKHRQTIAIGPHRLVADEPAEVGGEDAGPTPDELLEAALGACTSITVKMYADRKGWKLRSVRVDVTMSRAPDLTIFTRRIELEGDLDEAQRARCFEIANKCPVHRVLTGKTEIKSELTPSRKE